MRSLNLPSNLRPFLIPAGLLILAILSFGLLIPSLGFYWDDWPPLLIAQWKGVQSFWEFFAYDRPFSAWTFVVSFPLLGLKPLNWQIFSLLLRWLTAVCMWWSVRGVWPRRQREAAGMALLFLVYPIFTQQPISIAYSQHWTCYLLYFISLGAMVQSLRTPRFFWPLSGLALITSGVQLLTMEYFAGLELLRPLLLWVIASETLAGWRKRTIETLKTWLPYLILLGAYAIYRLFFMKLAGEDPNQVIAIQEIAKAPLATILHLVQNAMQDMIYMLLGVWQTTWKPETVVLTDRFDLFTWAMGGVAAAGVFGLLQWGWRKEENAEPEALQMAWARQVCLIGLAAMALGTLPVWLTDRQVIVGYYSSRFGLPAMLGASVLVIGGLEWLSHRRVAKSLVLAVLVGLSTSTHIQTANDYRWAWVKQTRFYWQMAWRVPNMQPQTPILSDGEIFPYVGLHATSAALNTIYKPEPAAKQMTHWFYSLGREFAYRMPEMLGGMPVDANYRTLNFAGNTRDSVVIYYDPDTSGCLWVLGPEDKDLPSLPAVTRQALPVASLNRITSDNPVRVPTDIFGPEPEHSWCYYYEKADLARQMKDWQKVVEIGEEAANQKGYTPTKSGSNFPTTWFPFIEGYAMRGNWDRAQQLTTSVLATDKRTAPGLCTVWKRVEASGPASPQRDAAVKAMTGQMGCGK